MAEGETQRRLAAVVAIDVAGYSRLMGADEQATLATLKAHREAVTPVIRGHGGRVVGTAGDGLLLEFPSVTAAVLCAVEVQPMMAERNADLPDDRKMLYRIGINLGDVMIDGDDIYGDGVNIAARLEGLADAGGVCISQTVMETVRDRIDIGFEDMGEVEVKNIARAVHVWRWSPGQAAAPITVSADDDAPPLPDKPSLVVLPFDNMSADPEQDYFADGITEDIIIELSRFHGLFVIARNTAFTYKGEKIDVPKVAAELGVHFVLEGSVRRAGDRVRVSAQLIDGGTGSHIWAERYDGKLEDVFDLQEEITRQVVASVEPQIGRAALAHLARGERRFDEALDLGWRSWSIFEEAVLTANQPQLDEAIEMVRRAVALNGKCAVAHELLVLASTVQMQFSWGDDPAGAADRALEYAEAAWTALPNTETAFRCLGLARLYKGYFEQAVRDFQRAHEINPNNADTLIQLATIKASLGDTGAAREHATLALRLSPKGPSVQLAHHSLAIAAFVERDHAAYVEWAQKSIQGLPTVPFRRAMMIAYAAEVGDEALLRTHLDKLNSFAPDFIPSLFRWRRVFPKDEHMDILLDGLRKAGLAE